MKNTTTQRTGKASSFVTLAQVKSLLASRIETKAASLTLSSASVPVAGTITYFSAIAEDDTIAGRTGLKIRPTRLELRVSAGCSATNTFRFILFKDNLGYGIAPLVTDVLSTASYTSPHSTIAASNARFTTIFDEIMTFSTNGELTHYTTKSIGLKGTIQFTGATNAQASSGAGAYYWLAIASGVGATPVAYDMGAVIYFTDA